MIVADVLMYLLLVLGTFLTLLGYWLSTQALFPAFVSRCRRRYRTRPVRSTAIGIAALLPIGLASFALAQLPHPGLKILGFGSLLFLFLLGLVGSTGLCQHIGFGLPSGSDESASWRRVLRGGVVLGLTFLLPFAGWFVILPWTIISGFGVSLGALFRPGTSQ